MPRLDEFHQKHRQIDDAIVKYFQSTREPIGFTGEIGGAALPTNVWAEWRSGKWVTTRAIEMESLRDDSQPPENSLGFCTVGD
jgi:hypothetical protein